MTSLQCAAFLRNTSIDEKAHDRRIDLFAIRCRDLRDQVAAGRLAFIDAVDMGYTAAIWSGLADDVGDDVVQRIMALAFDTLHDGSAAS
jgi:hypothetical protein